MAGRSPSSMSAQSGVKRQHVLYRMCAKLGQKGSPRKGTAEPFLTGADRPACRHMHGIHQGAICDRATPMNGNELHLRLATSSSCCTHPATCEGARVEEVAQLGGEGLELLHKRLGVLACSSRSIERSLVWQLGASPLGPY